MISCNILRHSPSLFLTVLETDHILVGRVDGVADMDQVSDILHLSQL